MTIKHNGGEGANLSFMASSQHLWFWMIIAGSAIYTSLIANRWLVTDLGLVSLGRVWHLVVAYRDLGFTRRTLLGSAIDIVNLRSLLPNEYVLALVVHGAQLFAAYALMISVFVKRGLAANIPLTAVVFLSPAFLIQIGYLSNSQDATLFLLAIIMVLVVRNPLFLSAITVAGVLTHELFLFYIPGIAALHWIQGRRNSAFAVAVSAIAAIVVVILAGRLTIDQEQYYQMMLSRLPVAAYKHPLWSGYFELSTTAGENWGMMQAFLVENARNVGFVVVPILYCLSLAWCAAKKLTRSQAILIFASIIAPLWIILIATDIYRWIGMSANIALLALISAARPGDSSPDRCFVALLPFSLLAPLGSFPWDRPFPVHQFILERIF